jgi:hypothetical protein
MFHAFSVVSGYRMHEFSKIPTTAEHLSPLFQLKKDTVSVSETLWVLSLIQWTVSIISRLCIYDKPFEYCGDSHRHVYATNVDARSAVCLYGVYRLAFLGF